MGSLRLTPLKKDARITSNSKRVGYTSACSETPLRERGSRHEALCSLAGTERFHPGNTCRGFTLLLSGQDLPRAV